MLTVITCVLCVRMEKCNEIPQEITNILHVLQLESEITEAERELQYSEAADTQNKINGHKRFLKEYLNCLYQVRALLLLALVQVTFRKIDGKISAPVEVQLLKHGATLSTFLVKSISPLPVVKKGDVRQYVGCAEMTAMLYNGSYLTVPTNTLIVCPVSNEVNKKPLKENEGQNEVSVVLPMCNLMIIYIIIVCRTQERNLLLLLMLTMLMEVCLQDCM